MRLYLAEFGKGESLWCPECEKILWPAYWTEEGLLVGYWSDFAPPEGQKGLLVCSNEECTYEEPITFTKSPTDAVAWDQEESWMLWEETAWRMWPQTWLAELIEETEGRLAQTGQAKLHSLLDLYRDEVVESQERIERWLAEATAKGYPVTLGAEEEKLSGRILGSDEESITIETPEGEVRQVAKTILWHLHIEYPRKPRRPSKHRNREEDGQFIGFPIGDDRYMVIEGHHLRYGGRTELGDRYKGRCWDPEVAAAMRLREVVPGYWEGVFTAEEVERFYYRHDYVLIRGHWVEEMSRIKKPPLVWVQTKDPAIAEALDLEPTYKNECDEFGSWDGEIWSYYEYLPLDMIEGERWEEEILEFPPEYD